MKRTERHHLKENEIERWTRETREFFETKGRETLALVVVCVVVGAVGLGYYGWRQHVQSRSSEMLAGALAVQQATVTEATDPKAPPQPGAYPTERARSEAALAKFKAAADAYPSTDAGLYARYQEAVTLLSLDRPADAIACYNDIIKQAGTSDYAQMARLGIAEAQARAGQFNQAIDGFKELAQRKDGPLPVDGILMHLGRVYLEAGKVSDARQTFNRVVEEFPDSPYASEAQQKLDQLKKT
jgi:TolA-binding protein